MSEALNLHAGLALVLFLLILVVLFASMANRLKVPYPILLVVAGLAISFIPHVPRVRLSPDLVFLVFLPPLIYASAWQTDFRRFRAEIVPISLLAFGLVGFTVLGVALISGHFISAFDFRSGFVLGAVVAATDAVAAGAIGKTVGLPRHVLSLLEGESLLNDATSLLALEFALSLMLKGDPPTLLGGSGRLLWLVAGGLLTGLVIGYIAHRIEKHIADGPIEIVFSLVLPYTAYLLAEEIKASGILAVVACGLYLSRYRSTIFTASARIEIQSAWKALDFLLNGLVFVLIGLQLPYVLAGIRGYGAWTLVLYGLVFSLVLIALRMAWVYPFSYLLRGVRHLLGRDDVKSSTPRELFVIGWTGMRGVISLAAAISVPETLDNGQPFTQRNLIVFLTFSIILVTLVLQGLTLPALVRALGLAGGSDKQEEAEARKTILEAALSFLKKQRASLSSGEERHPYDDMIHRYTHRLEDAEVSPEEGEADGEQAVNPRLKLARKVTEVERRALYRLEDEGKVDEEIVRRLERHLDLMEADFQTFERLKLDCIETGALVAVS